MMELDDDVGSLMDKQRDDFEDTLPNFDHYHQVNKPEPDEVKKVPMRQELEHEALACDGCGVPLQYDDAERLGFIPRLKVSQYFRKKKELQQMLENDNADATLGKVLRGEQIAAKEK